MKLSPLVIIPDTSVQFRAERFEKREKQRERERGRPRKTVVYHSLLLQSELPTECQTLPIRETTLDEGTVCVCVCVCKCLISLLIRLAWANTIYVIFNDLRL